MTTRKPPTADALRHVTENAKRLLDATRPKLDEALTRANSDIDEGLKPAAAGPAVNNGGDAPDLFARAFIKVGKGDDIRWVPKTDYIAATLDDLVASLEQCARSAAAAYVAATDLCAISPEAARIFLEASDKRHCVNCTAPAVRLRAGRCDPCYMWRIRHHGEDRPRDQW